MTRTTRPRRRKRGPRPKPAATGGPFTIYSIPGAGREMGVSRKVVTPLIAEKLLPARRLGGHVVVLKADLERFFAALPVVTSVDGAISRIVAKAQAAGDDVVDVER